MKKVSELVEHGKKELTKKITEKEDKGGEEKKKS